jgi:thioester reductase-like protein
MLDLAPEATEDEATKLLAEIEDSQGEDHLAFRDGGRYVARLVRKQLPEFQGVAFQSDGTYLITGGLGALGLRIARWMVEQGARQLVLTSRRGASSEAQETLSQLEQAGAKVLVAQADVSNEEDMVRVLEEVSASMLPLRGIVHAAGVSRYEAIADMEPNALESVLRPKVVGTWILHQLTQAMKLDFFVSFSSISSVWGSRGQAQYAAANHFLDVLAHYRQGLGLPALSVNWGPWAGGGMALEEFQTVLSRMGVEGLQPEKAIAALNYLLTSDSAQTVVADVDWRVFKELYEMRAKGGLLADLEYDQMAESQSSSMPVADSSSGILQQLTVASSENRYSILVSYLQTEIARILGFNSPKPLDSQAKLFDLGMDSLMAMDIVRLICSEFKKEFSVIDLLQAPSIHEVAELLLRQITQSTVSSNVQEMGFSLVQEAILDETIVPSILEPQRGREIQSILLTGASGFLGAFLLNSLLHQTKAKLYCLVREKDKQLGLEKIKANMNRYKLWNEQHTSRIIPIIGDLANLHLGLNDKEYSELSQDVDVIYHSAAILNFVYPYFRLKPVNVLGTQEILRFACDQKIKPLHYISTDAVFDSSAYYDKEVDESESILHTEGIDLGYTQSKWVAEKLVTVARERGLPVAIYRPPLITGDSRTGVWNTEDFTCLFLKGCIQLGCIPDIKAQVTFVPVDYVSQAIVTLSQQEQSLGNVFHLTNPHKTMWNDVAQWIDGLGHPLQIIPYEIWEKNLKEVASKGENVLSPLLPFFLKRWSDEQLTFAQLAQRRVKLDCQTTVAQLSHSNVTCHPVDIKLLNTYFSYFGSEKFV